MKHFNNTGSAYLDTALRSFREIDTICSIDLLADGGDLLPQRHLQRVQKPERTQANYACTENTLCKCQTYLKPDVSDALAAAQASITAKPKSVAPAPPSAQWLATTAAVAPAAKLKVRTSSSSASVSVANLQHGEYKMLK